MNDLILITVSAIGGGIVGFLGCAVVTSGKLADYSRAIYEAEDEADAQRGIADLNRAAHRVIMDRIDRALACVTENSAHVGKKMARILRGDA